MAGGAVCATMGDANTYFAPPPFYFQSWCISVILGFHMDFVEGQGAGGSGI